MKIVITPDGRAERRDLKVPARQRATQDRYNRRVYRQHRTRIKSWQDKHPALMKKQQHRYYRRQAILRVLRKIAGGRALNKWNRRLLASITVKEVRGIARVRARVAAHDRARAKKSLQWRRVTPAEAVTLGVPDLAPGHALLLAPEQRRTLRRLRHENV